MFTASHTHHPPQDYQKYELYIIRLRSYLPHRPEGSDTFGSSAAWCRQNLVYQRAPWVNFRRISQISWGHQEDFQYHIKAAKYYLKLNGATPGFLKLTLCPLHWIFTSLTKTRKIILSLMEFKPAARALIKRQQRAAIAWIVTIQNYQLFRR